MTRSPILSPVTPSATSFTTPATSPPGENGSSGLNWYLPWMISVSGKFTPHAFTDRTTCPFAAFGDGTFSTTSFSGNPSSLHNTAFIFKPFGHRGHREHRAKHPAQTLNSERIPLNSTLRMHYRLNNPL